MKLTAIVALLVATSAGCAGSGGGPNGPGYVAASNSQNLPAPTPPTSGGTSSVPTTQPLTVQVTNATSAVIDVVVSTPDETMDLGSMQPGDTFQATLDELPASVTFSATAQSTDANGNVPTFVPLTESQGNAFASSNPFAGVAFQDGFSQGIIAAPVPTAQVVFAPIVHR
jgi:hypothetical protein